MKVEVDAILGRVIREFTLSENILRECGAFIDELIAAETEESFNESVASMWIKIQSLKLALADMEKSVTDYLTPSSSAEVEQ